MFIDAENLINWIKNEGPEKLLEELSTQGQVIVRRAYGKWTNQNLSQLQENLNHNGFELLHNFHPVSGKNSSDIQMTIDAMEYALKLTDVSWFVLATGDSDFSPLFRKLREIGKEVIGIGPKSPLSECVKTSCSRYIYTHNDNTEENEILAFELDEIEDLLEKIIDKHEGSINIANLKNQILQIDNAFNEKQMGFKNFTSFIDSLDFLKHEKDMVSYRRPSDAATSYKTLLKRKNWDFLPKTIVNKLYKACDGIPVLPRQQIVDKLVTKNIEGTSSSIIRKFLNILHKSKLAKVSQIIDDEKTIEITKTNDYLQKIDFAMLSRLLSAIHESNSKIEKDKLKKLLYGNYTDKEFEKIILAAKENVVNKDDNDH
ncbi:MAG: NYN domain-containing protein [Fibrobacter sp.]|nr:NYN domain-containing protein [Fibrobacter sp.]